MAFSKRSVGLLALAFVAFSGGNTWTKVWAQDGQPEGAEAAAKAAEPGGSKAAAGAVQPMRMTLSFKLREKNAFVIYPRQASEFIGFCEEPGKGDAPGKVSVRSARTNVTLGVVPRSAGSPADALLSASGEWVAVMVRDGQKNPKVEVWSVKTGKLQATMAMEFERATLLDFAGNDRLVTRYERGDVGSILKSWDVKTGGALVQAPPLVTRWEAGMWSFSADGKYLAIVIDDYRKRGEPSVALFDGKTLEAVAERPEYVTAGPVAQVRFSPDSAEVALLLGGKGQVLEVQGVEFFSAETGKQIRQIPVQQKIKAHRHGEESLINEPYFQYSADGRYFLLDGTMLYSASTPGEIHRFAEPTGAIARYPRLYLGNAHVLQAQGAPKGIGEDATYSLAVLPASKFNTALSAVNAGESGLDGKQPELAKVDFEAIKPVSLSVESDLKAVTPDAPAQGGEGVSGKMKVTLPPKSNPVMVDSPVGATRIVIAPRAGVGQDEKQVPLSVFVLDVVKGKTQGPYSAVQGTRVIAASAQAEQVAVLSSRATGDRIDVYDVSPAPFKLMHKAAWVPDPAELGRGHGPILWARFLGDGSFLTFSAAGMLTAWRVEGAAPIYQAKLDPRFTPMVSPGGGQLFVGLESTIICLDAKTGAKLAQVTGPIAARTPESFAISPDGARLARVSVRANFTTRTCVQVETWDLKSPGAPKAADYPQPWGAATSYAQCVWLSPKLLATLGGTIVDVDAQAPVAFAPEPLTGSRIFGNSMVAYSAPSNQMVSMRILPEKTFTQGSAVDRKSLVVYEVDEPIRVEVNEVAAPSQLNMPLFKSRLLNAVQSAGVKIGPADAKVKLVFTPGLVELDGPGASSGKGNEPSAPVKSGGGSSGASGGLEAIKRAKGVGSESAKGGGSKAGSGKESDGPGETSKSGTARKKSGYMATFTVQLVREGKVRREWSSTGGSNAFISDEDLNDPKREDILVSAYFHTAFAIVRRNGGIIVMDQPSDSDAFLDELPSSQEEDEQDKKALPELIAYTQHLIETSQSLAAQISKPGTDARLLRPMVQRLVEHVDSLKINEAGVSQAVCHRFNKVKKAGYTSAGILGREVDYWLARKARPGSGDLVKFLPPSQALSAVIKNELEPTLKALKARQAELGGKR
jgi:hypothetical protein